MSRNTQQNSRIREENLPESLIFPVSWKPSCFFFIFFWRGHVLLYMNFFKMTSKHFPFFLFHRSCSFFGAKTYEVRFAFEQATIRSNFFSWNIFCFESVLKPSKTSWYRQTKIIENSMIQHLNQPACQCLITLSSIFMVQWELPELKANSSGRHPIFDY